MGVKTVEKPFCPRLGTPVPLAMPYFFNMFYFITDMHSKQQLRSLIHWHCIKHLSYVCLSGPDVDSLTTEITLQVPTQAELGNKLSSLSSTCTDSQDTEAGDDDEEGREDSSHRPVGVQRFPPTLS